MLALIPLRTPASESTRKSSGKAEKKPSEKQLPIAGGARAARAAEPGAAKARAAEVRANKLATGKRLYEAYQCADCHLISGYGCREGVSLDDVGSRRTVDFIKAQLRNPEEHVAKNPQAFGGDPNLMPFQNLSPQEVDALSHYLFSLKSKSK